MRGLKGPPPFKIFRVPIYPDDVAASVQNLQQIVQRVVIPKAPEYLDKFG